MALVDFQSYVRFLPTLKQSPQGNLWLAYDEEVDILYINFKKPGMATDSELTDEDIIIRYEGEEIIGYTILNASKR